MTVAEFQAKYLTQPGGLLVGAERFGVASTLKELEDRLAAGEDPDVAHQRVEAKEFNRDQMFAGLRTLGLASDVLSDFQSIDSL